MLCRVCSTADHSTHFHCGRIDGRGDDLVQVRKDGAVVVAGDDHEAALPPEEPEAIAACLLVGVEETW